MDIWVDNSGSASSTLYTNDGNQNFTESSIVGNIHLQQLTDVNHDGDIDILFLSYTQNYARWSDYRCGGYGPLGSMPSIDTDAIRAGDMDNDGDTDFIAASSQGPIYYKNDGFLNYSDHSFDNNNTAVPFLCDLDGDGDLDPLFVESFSAIIWYENRLTGDSLDFGDRQGIAPLDMDPRDVLAVDIDGDGDADVAAVSRNDDKVVWYENRLNEPSGDFGPEQLGVTSADGPIRILSADLNGDGGMDLITLSENDEELIWFENTGVTDIDDEETSTPLIFGLEQNYPNPFNPITNFGFRISDFGFVSLKIYDVMGSEVAVLVNEEKQPGEYQAQWDAREFASGIYIYRLRAGEFVQTRKMVLLK
jgi:hypothetical protein